METTQIKSGHEELMHPAAVDGDRAVEAYERAPTLMAGEAPGSQGQVQVWVPDKKRHWRSFVVSSMAIPLIVAIKSPYWLFHPTALSWLFLSIFALSLLIGTYTVFRKPCYITTDDAGIGITTWKGSQALRWVQILSVKDKLDFRLWSLIRCGETIHPSLTVYGSEPLHLNLSGYPGPVRQQLLELIVEKANLRQDVNQKTLYKWSNPKSLPGPVRTGR